MGVSDGSGFNSFGESTQWHENGQMGSQLFVEGHGGESNGQNRH